MIELGQFCIDKATGIEGMVTHLQVEMDGSEYLKFQPRGLNPKTGQPVDAMWLVEARLEGGNRIDHPDLPTHVLGTIVTDEASGFTGMAIALVYHINGCVHFNVQSKGQQDSGAPIEAANFDIRRLKGDAIKPMTKAEQKKDEKERPSPSEGISYKPRF